MKVVATTGDAQMIILQRGEELIAQLEVVATSGGMTAGWLSGLGGASAATLGFYDPVSRQYEWTEYDEPLEILSLTGNLAMVDDRPFWHVHGVFSGRDGRVIGGHVQRLTIGLTGELQITTRQAALMRVYDDVTGLKLIDAL